MIVFIFVSIILLIILLRPRYQHPRVIRNVFSHKVCDHIIELATPNLKPSLVGTTSEGGSVDTSERKSETAWLAPDTSDTVRRVMDKCVSTTDRQFANAEYLQVLKYQPGGFYNPHQDVFDRHEEPNPRVNTCIIALNDDYEGGETVFPTLQKEYKLNKGDVLLFNTLNDWGFQTQKALHGGKSVISGEKWVCNLWIHQYPYDQHAPYR
jgi:hypothetical protein|tara:strand:- start:249 stop:875 length:627 start_codon:yes stop_codon:yes gene_type:complete